MKIVFDNLIPEGTNVLAPKPCSQLYHRFSEPHNIEIRYFDLLEGENFKANAEHIKSLCDKNTRAIIIVNTLEMFGQTFSDEDLA